MHGVHWADGVAGQQLLGLAGAGDFFGLVERGELFVAAAALAVLAANVHYEDGHWMYSGLSTATAPYSWTLAENCHSVIT